MMKVKRKVRMEVKKKKAADQGGALNKCRKILKTERIFTPTKKGSLLPFLALLLEVLGAVNGVAAPIAKPVN